jgi:hypothetical protein
MVAFLALAVSVKIVCPWLEGWITPAGTPSDFTPLASALKSLLCHTLVVGLAFAVVGCIPGWRRSRTRFREAIALANPGSMWAAFTMAYVAFPNAPYAYLTIATWTGFGILGSLAGIAGVLGGGRVATSLTPGMDSDTKGELPL